MQPDQSTSRNFLPFFRLHVHLLIAWGYEDARHRISNDTDEPSITGFIVEAIDNRLRSPHRPGWFEQYLVKEDSPIPGEGRSGKDRLKPDIIIGSTTSSRPEYIFEAKRLRKPGFTVTKYIGSDGMGCFINEDYAEQYNEAGMLGYVQSNSLEDWQSRVKTEIDNRADELQLNPPQQDVQITEAFPLEWVSEHERDNVGHPIAIYHILLDCCEQN